MNYNTFLTNLLVMPLMIIISYYCQLLQQVELWTDPYTVEKYTEQGKQDFILYKMLTMVSVVFMFQISHYLTQRDMSIVVIEKHMITRQQT